MQKAAIQTMFDTPPDTPATPTTPRTMLESEFEPHYTAWKADPNPKNAQTLLKTVNPVVTSAMRTFAGNAAASPTLRSKAKLLVLDALPRYDPTKSKLRTYLMTNLQSLHRATAEENQIVSVPERVRLNQHKLYTASQDLTDKLGREPSDQELSTHTGLSLKRLEHVRKSQGSLAEGQTRSVNEEGEEVSGGPAVMSQDNNSTWLRFIYADLDPRDQFIMEHTLGMHGKGVIPKGEIAKRLGVSAGAVSQRAARIQQLIDSKEELAGNLF